MNIIKTLEDRISEALYPSSSDNVVLDPPSDDQVDTHALNSDMLYKLFRMQPVVQ